MRIRNTGHHTEEKAPLRMTAMIDIVFLLLVFFIMTFKIVSPEGDFNVHMPQEQSDATRSSAPPPLLPPIKVRMLANADGSLRGATMGAQRLDPQNPMGDLHRRIVYIVGENTGPASIAESMEVEFDCDYDLDFEHVIAAMTAVSGHVADDGNVIKLVEKIKFSAPKSHAD